MISDLQPFSPGGPELVSVPRGTGFGLAVQPVKDVASYLETRRPVAICHDEPHLLLAVPECEDNTLRSETKALCDACVLVLGRVKQNESVQAACKAVLNLFAMWQWKLGTFRPKYDLWARVKDWVVLVNRAHAGFALMTGKPGGKAAFTAIKSAVEDAHLFFKSLEREAK